MRISTNEFLLGALPELLNQESAVNQLNEEIATGQTMLDATSDPAGAGEAMQLSGAIAQLNYDASNAAGGTLSLQNTLSVLQQVSTVLDQLRQTALQGADASTSPAERQALATTAHGQLQQLLQLANSQDPDGNYLFAGSSATAAPFVTEADGQIDFVGDAAVNSVTIAPGVTVPVTATGQGIFTSLPAGSNGVSVTAGADNTGTAFALVQGISSVSQLTAERLAGTQYQIEFGPGSSAGSLAYTVVSGSGAPGTARFAASSGVIASGGFVAGQDLQFAGLDVAIDGAPAAGDNFTVDPEASTSVFQTVQQLISGLSSTAGTLSSASLQQVQNAIANLDDAQNALVSTQASLGSALAEVQAVQGENQTDTTNAQAQLSNLQSANLPQVLANYSASVTALQAAELAFSRIQNLSLFSVIQP
jgi:flagellar hook-associated protein 3 FlgL